jgi:ankyrin repeat protein
MGNYPATSINETGKCSSIFESCSSLSELDVDELAIHKDVGTPRGKICPEAMKYLDHQSKALMFAASGTNPLQIKKYISFGASPNTYDQNRTSPLHIACRSGNLDVVKELVSQRSNIDITDCAGWSSLHIASCCSHYKIVEYLLSCGANPTALNSRGETPFDLAYDSKTQKEFLKYWGSQEIVYRSDPAIKLQRSFTPYSEDSSIFSDHWMKLGYINLQYSLIDIEDVSRKIFNNNYRKGLAIMIAGKIIPQDPLEIAAYLFSTSRLSPVRIGEILGDSTEYIKQISAEYMNFIQIDPNNIILSLKRLLKLIKLPKGLMSDQVLDSFSEKFYTPNGPFLSKDSVHHLCFSIIRLNTYLHEQYEDISLEEYIKSNRGLHEGGDFPETYLTWIYNSIKSNCIHEVFHEQIEPVFEDMAFSGYLKYKFNKEWKDRYFVLSHKALWSYKSTMQSTPYECIPLWNVLIELNTDHFIIKGNICYLKFSEDGKASIQYFTTGIFKTDKHDTWVQGLKSL